MACAQVGGGQAYPNVVYASPGGKNLSLNLVVPRIGDNFPIIIWIHGGGWYSGTKESSPLLPLVQEGYAIASIDYRLSTEAPFPAQIGDCKAAVRWVRSNAAHYHLAPNRIGVIGFSAGGHLAALLGTSGGVAALEGNEGNPGVSSRVQAVVDGFGPSDFVSMDREWSARGDAAPGLPPYHGQLKPREALAALLGGPVESKLDLAKEASPLTYVNAGNPPFLILHGDHDQTVPISQSVTLTNALKQAGVPVELEIAPNAGHGSNPYYPPFIKAFFAKYLKSKP
jgi:acetyl esterase/lipase